MLPNKLSFVDIETSGSNALNDRIIEIAVIQVENGEVVNTFDTLVNPEGPIHPYTTYLTGISAEDVENAPTFSEISDDLYDMLKDTLFVAHNVRFDYGFIKNELGRLGYTFSTKQLCTVKLARKLYPGHQRYNLDSIIERHNIECEARHRAMGDTQVIHAFYQQSIETFGEEKVMQAVCKICKRPSVPISISENKLGKIPEGSGVYIFRDKNNAPLYVGKSVNLRNRVLSHFSSDYLNSTDMKLAKDAHNIETIETSGEMSALLLESSLIKDLQPIYNRQLRRQTKMIALVQEETTDGYLTLNLIQTNELDVKHIENLVGVYRSHKQAVDFLRQISKDFQLCNKLLGIEKTKKSCFGYQLNACKGACLGEENHLAYNIRFIQAVSNHKVKSWPFKGPVIIKENNSVKEGFLVDKWCLLGKTNGVVPEVTKNDYVFDYDTYKILKKFILNKKKSNISLFNFS